MERSAPFQITRSASVLNRVAKRAFDVVCAFFGLLILSPLFAYIAIRIKHDSPGPVYFRGRRSGLHGREFLIHKFRTMFEKPETYAGDIVTGKDDKRITPFGEWLRDTKVNELPQLWNVLVGEMSLVGPRPEDPAIVATWPEDLRAEVLSVRPGITSPASVTYHNEQDLLEGESILDEYLQTILPDKLRLDQIYVRHHNFLGDLDVIFMTLTLFIPAFRKRKLPEVTLFEGPFTWFTRNYIVWFVVDTFVAFCAISLAILIWRIQSPLDVGFGRMVLVAAGLAFGLAITNTLFGLKQVSWRYASPTHVLDIALSTSLALLLFSLLDNIYPEIRLPVPLMVDFGLFSFFGFVATRYRERLITGLASRWVRWRAQSSLLGERVLVVGAGDCAQLGMWLMEKSNLANSFSIVGLVDDDFRKVNQRVNGYPVLGTTYEIPEVVAKRSIGLIMFAITRVTEKDRERILSTCKNLPVRILMIPDLQNIVNDYFMKKVNEV